jgi:hypothetical protein
MRIFLYSFLLIQCFFIVSCQNGESIAKKLYSKCADKQACRLPLKDVTDFKWDKVYIFSERTSLEEIDRTLGFHYKYWEDTGERIIFVSNTEVVYHEDRFPDAETKNGTTLYMISNRTYIGQYNTAVFSVEKKEIKEDKYVYLVTPN